MRKKLFTVVVTDPDAMENRQVRRWLRKVERQLNRELTPKKLAEDVARRMDGLGEG